MLEKLFFFLSLVLGVAAFFAPGRATGLVAEMSAFLGPALLLYALLTRVHAFPSLERALPRPLRFTWGIRRHPVADLVVALLTGCLGQRLAQVPAVQELVGAGLVQQWIGAGVGAVVGIWIVTLVFAPKTGVAVVNCFRDMPPEEKQQARRNHGDPRYPLVWPYLVVARVGGSVVWHLRGEPGHEITIEFPDDFRPFGQSKVHRWTETVPGTIAVGPVVEPGSGEYKLTCVDEDGNKVEVDPGGDFPRAM